VTGGAQGPGQHAVSTRDLAALTAPNVIANGMTAGVLLLLPAHVGLPQVPGFARWPALCAGRSFASGGKLCGNTRDRIRVARMRRA
jgi:hypothetical protein